LRLCCGGTPVSGRTPDSVYVEIVEVADHPWFLGCQFHPEFKSAPLKPHPLFAAFIGASNQHKLARGRARSSHTAAAGHPLTAAD